MCIRDSLDAVVAPAPGARVVALVCGGNLDLDRLSTYLSAG